MGSYVSGELQLTNNTSFYIFIGTKGGDVVSNSVPGKGGYNGGVDGAEDNVDQNSPSPGSGGATDMRLSREDKYSRIMVAGGGGAGGSSSVKGGNAGGIEGGKGQDVTDAAGGEGGTQSSGNKNGVGDTPSPGDESPGGGGGGYFGGLAGKWSKRPGVGASGGGGGSSYISGFTPCIAYNQDGTQRDSSIHYSNLYFRNPLMLYNSMTIPSPYSENDFYTEGYIGDGAARITFLYTFTCSCKTNSFDFSFLIFNCIMLLSR